MNCASRPPPCVTPWRAGACPYSSRQPAATSRSWCVVRCPADIFGIVSAIGAPCHGHPVPLLVDVRSTLIRGGLPISVEIRRFHKSRRLFRNLPAPEWLYLREGIVEVLPQVIPRLPFNSDRSGCIWHCCGVDTIEDAPGKRLWIGGACRMWRLPQLNWKCRLLCCLVRAVFPINRVGTRCWWLTGSILAAGRGLARY